MSNDSTQRFTDRVSNYVKYRPGYPQEVIGYLEKEGHLSTHSAIADVGAGTGIFTRLLLEKGYNVYAVEPNEAMRGEADRQLSHFPGYCSLAGRADLTGLASQSIDLIVCAQSFHWFNTTETRVEFQRILKSGGQVALVWNNRDIRADAFAAAYDALLKTLSGGDYETINHQNLTPADFKRFYKDAKYVLTKFQNRQVFDFEQLAGRAFSSSYVPPEDTDAGKAFKADLKAVFDSHQQDGKVVFRYDTEVYLGMV
jgi:ubiquinone/menaquinone biosynthesis C-methylase UbiE